MRTVNGAPGKKPIADIPSLIVKVCQNDSTFVSVTVESTQTETWCARCAPFRLTKDCRTGSPCTQRILSLQRLG